MRTGRYGRNPRLTGEQEAIRLKGLRILARIIVRAHLKSLIAQDAGRNGSYADSPSMPDGGVKEGKDAG